MIIPDSKTEKGPFRRSFFYCLKLEKLNGANSATSQTELQSFNKQNYKQKSTTKVPIFRSFQTMEKCNLTNRNANKSQAEMQSNHKQNERKEKKKERSKERIKSKRKILKEVNNIYII